jgi:glutamate formiminotransferase/glutamate formiminotransferase/formiminotetrahydrofolate cyclodeaminase
MNSPPATPLLAVPNVSEGRDGDVIDAIGTALASAPGVRLLDTHADPDHHRSVFTLAGAQGELLAAVLAGARVAVERIDVMSGARGPERGAHPHVGALDVAPIVYLDTHRRGAACAEALVLAHEIGELGVPVLLYGELARGRSRADLRRGGVSGLAERLQSGELRADFGPQRLHPTAGATLVAAREPLVAFNLELAAPADVRDARRIAAQIREGGAEGLPGLRAIGVELRVGGAPADASATAGGETTDAPVTAGPSAVAQVSTNVERPLEVPLRAVVEAVATHAPIARVELVGLAPRAALQDLPADIPWRGGDPAARTIENALGF